AASFFRSERLGRKEFTCDGSPRCTGLEDAKRSARDDSGRARGRRGARGRASLGDQHPWSFGKVYAATAGDGRVAGERHRILKGEPEHKKHKRHKKEHLSVSCVFCASCVPVHFSRLFPA